MASILLQELDAAICYKQENPKKPGPPTQPYKSFARYESYKAAKTLQETLDLGGSRGDIVEDFRKGYLTCADAELQARVLAQLKEEEKQAADSKKRKADQQAARVPGELAPVPLARSPVAMPRMEWPASSAADPQVGAQHGLGMEHAVLGGPARVLVRPQGPQVRDSFGQRDEDRTGAGPAKHDAPPSLFPFKNEPTPLRLDPAGQKRGLFGTCSGASQSANLMGPGFFLQERGAGNVPAGRMPFPSKQAVHVPAQAEQLLGQQASASHHAPAPEAPSIFGTLPRGSIDQRAAQIQMHGNDVPLQQKGHSLFSGLAASHQQQAAPERGAPVGFSPAQFQHERQVAPQLGRPFGSSMMQQGLRAPPVQNGGGIGGLARRPAKLQILHARLDEVYASIAACGCPDLEDAFFQGLCKRFDRFSQLLVEDPDLARPHQGPRGMAMHRHSSQTQPQKKARQDAGPSIQELRDAYLANAHLGNRPMSERLPRHAEDKRLPLTRDADDGPNSLTEKRKALEVKKKKDPNAPKMPTGGGYGCFFEENFAKIVATLPAGHKITDVAKAAGAQWKTLSDEIKKPYAAMYQKKMDLYKVAMEEYKKNNPVSVKEEEHEEAEDEATVPGASASSSGPSSRKRGRADGQNAAMPVAAPSASDASAPAVAPAAPAAAEGMIGDASAPAVAPAAASAAAEGMIGDASAFAVPRSPGIWNLREHMFTKRGAAAASAAAAGMTGEGADDQHAAMPGDASAPAVAPAAAEEPAPAEEPAAAVAPAPASAAAAGMIAEGADDQHAAMPGEVAVPAASSADDPDLSDGDVPMPAEESDQ